MPEVFGFNRSRSALWRLHDEPSALSMQAHSLAVDLADQKHRSTRRFAYRKPDRVAIDRRLDRLSDFALQPKKTVSRNHVSDPLVRTEVVVVIDKMLESLPGLGQLLWPSSAPELGLYRVPKPLAFSERLRMLRARDDVLDAVPDQQLLKFIFSAPAEVLSTLVRQRLLGLSEFLNPVLKNFDHKLRGLLQGERPGHDVPAVIVHEDGEINLRPMAHEREARDVALPKLHGLGPLETPGLLRSPRSSSPRHHRRRDFRFFKRLSHRSGRYLCTAKTPQKALHASQTKRRIRKFCLFDRSLELGRCALWAALLASVAVNTRFERLGTLLLIELYPFLKRVRSGYSPEPPEILQTHSALEIRLNRLPPLLRGIGPRLGPLRARLFLRSCFAFRSFVLGLYPRAQCRVGDACLSRELLHRHAGAMELVYDSPALLRRPKNALSSIS